MLGPSRSPGESKNGLTSTTKIDGRRHAEVEADVAVLAGETSHAPYWGDLRRQRRHVAGVHEFYRKYRPDRRCGDVKSIH